MASIAPNLIDSADALWSCVEWQREGALVPYIDALEAMEARNQAVQSGERLSLIHI